jgi:hypothetical protein
MLHLILRKKGNDMELLIDQIEKSFDEKKVLQGASFTF